MKVYVVKVEKSCYKDESDSLGTDVVQKLGYSDNPNMHPK